jgi:hypothetical protein
MSNLAAHFAVAIIIPLLTITCPAVAAMLPMNDPAPPTSIQPQPPALGDGFNEISGATAGRCFTYSDNDVKPVDPGGLTPVTVTDVTSSASIRQEVGLSASASFGLGIYSGSASTNFYKQTIGSHYAHYIYVFEQIDKGSSKIDTGADDIGPTTLGKVALAQPSTFLARCGTAFISGEAPVHNLR